jgi:hypothetical protein
MSENKEQKELFEVREDPKNSINYDGNSINYDGNSINYDGNSINYDGNSINYNGNSINYNGNSINYNGNSINYDGNSINYDGNSINYDGNNVKKPKIEIQKGFLFMSGRDLTLDELNLILPNTNYEIHDFKDPDTVNMAKLENYGKFNEKETLFFIKIVYTKDHTEKKILKYLLDLLKGDRHKKKKAEKHLRKMLDNKILIEKIILLFISQNLTIKDKERILRILDEILKTKNVNLYKELFYSLVLLLENDTIKNGVLNVLSHFYLARFDNIFDLIENELESEEKRIQEALSKIIALSVIYYGYKNVLRGIVGNEFKKKNCRNTFIFLKAHFRILGFVNDQVSDFIEEMLDFLDKSFNVGYRYIKIEISNIISHLCINGIIDDKESAKFSDMIIREIFSFFNLRTDKDDILCEIIRKHLILPTTHQEISYIVHLLRSLAYLSQNNQISSQIAFEILSKLDKFDINCVKIFYRICENLDYASATNYLIKNITRFLDKNFLEYKTMVVTTFLKILPNTDIEEKLINMILIKDTSDTALEILYKYENSLTNNIDLYKENLVLLIKNNNEFPIKNVIKLFNISNANELDWFRIFEIGKNKIKATDKKTQILGYHLIKRILCKIESADLKKFGEILYEKLDKSNHEILDIQLSVLSKIYQIAKFREFTDLILDLSPILKIKNDRVKEKAIIFISTILKYNKNTQHNINKPEFLRICYDVMDYLSFWYIKSKQCAFDLLIQISDYIAPQEIVNIYTEFLESNTKNVKKGLILGISRLADHVGLYNILPILLVDYKYVDDKVKLVIARTISKCDISILYLPFVIPIFEDCILTNNIEFRICGIEMCNEILNKINKTEMNTRIIIHFINLVWYNILETNVLIKKKFNSLIEIITKLFGTEFIVKYIVLGLFHPSKRIRKRYIEVLDIVKKYGDVSKHLKFLEQEIC